MRSIFEWLFQAVQVLPFEHMIVLEPPNHDARCDAKLLGKMLDRVARLPITVAQFAPFVPDGYRAEAKPHWTKNGWKWKGDRTEPYLWNHPQYSQLNQPVVGVTWYEATAFCAWLTAQLGAALPDGYALRLPTEAEWEAAAAFDGAGQRTYPWVSEEEPTPDLAIYDAANLQAPAPVGCCPAGAAACGTLDMAGNVWEWTASNHGGYPQSSAAQEKDFTNRQSETPLRGGSYRNRSTSVRCGARNWCRPDYGNDGLGFRVVVAPRRVR